MSLQLPLPAVQGARLLLLAHLRLLGSARSGHWGHSSVKGRKGGSAPKESFHGTSVTNARKILLEGLKPNNNAVFVAHDKELALHYAMGKQGKTEHIAMVVIDKAAAKLFDKSSKPGGFSQGHRTIPASLIKEVRVYSVDDVRSWRRAGTSGEPPFKTLEGNDDFYVILLLEAEQDDTELETLGGPGSGHHGHAGRPGQKGGSAQSTSSSALPERIETVAEIIAKSKLPGYKPSIELSEPIHVETSVTRWLTPSETKALGIWVGVDYDEGNDPDSTVAPEGRHEVWNAALRGSQALESVDKKHVQALMSAIETSKTKEEVVLFRGVGGDAVSKLKEGTTFKDKGFTSLTNLKDVAKNFTYAPAPNPQGGGRVFEIRVPKGTSLLDVTGALGDKGGAYDEGEFLLPPGTHFKVLSLGEKSVLQILGGRE